jgi:hypothetical protein
LTTKGGVAMKDRDYPTRIRGAVSIKRRPAPLIVNQDSQGKIKIKVYTPLIDVSVNNQSINNQGKRKNKEKENGSDK